MRTCWAAALGDCQGKLSREHSVSGGMWLGQSIYVHGLPWCRDEPKKVGLESMTVRHLCEGHNSSLSPVDRGGINAFKAIRAAAQFQNNRLRLVRDEVARLPWFRVQWSIDGPLLERWFLKTTINLLGANTANRIWRLPNSNEYSPPDDLVLAAFGQSSLIRPAGLYAAGTTGEAVEFPERVTMTSLHGEGVLAFAYTFGGLRFLLWLSAEPVPNRLTTNHSREEAWRDSTLIYHVSRLKFLVQSRSSHFVDLAWPERVPCDLRL